MEHSESTKWTLSDVLQVIGLIALVIILALVFVALAGWSVFSISADVLEGRTSLTDLLKFALFVVGMFAALSVVLGVNDLTKANEQLKKQLEEQRKELKEGLSEMQTKVTESLVDLRDSLELETAGPAVSDTSPDSPFAFLNFDDPRLVAWAKGSRSIGDRLATLETLLEETKTQIESINKQLARQLAELPERLARLL